MIAKLSKFFKSGERDRTKDNRGGEFDQNTLYTCMVIQQWKLFGQLIYTDKKRKL
jgi:hypothetical protein